MPDAEERAGGRARFKMEFSNDTFFNGPTSYNCHINVIQLLRVVMRRRSRSGFSHAGYLKTAEETYPCYFTNMTRTSAIVIFDGPIDLPDRFTIHLTADGKVARQCEVRWHEGNQFGVSFGADERS